jgi:hypothetical protein
MIKLLNSTAFLVALLFVSSTASAVVCTPATINPSAIARIVPHSSIGTVMAAMGCVPTEQAYSPIANATIYRFKIQMVDVFVDVVVDSQGVVFAEYIDFTNPIAGSYNGALRVNLPPLWVPSAGTILSR